MTTRVRRGVTLVEVLSIAALCAFAAHTVLPDSGSVAYFFDYRLYYAIVVSAAALTIARAVAVPLNRGAWIALSVAVTSYATAEFLWLFLYPDADSAPYPSIADAFYLAFYPASYIGLLLLLRARLRSLTPGVWVDGVTGAFAVGALGSAVLIGVVVDTTSGSASVVATNIAYPLGDVILLSLVFAGFALTRWRPGRAWAFLGASLSVSALADSAYLYATATGTYDTGGLLDAAWPTGLLLIGIAAWQDTGREHIVDVRGRTMLVAPALCAVVAVAVLVVDHFHRLNLLAIALATLALTGVLARLVVTFRENRTLLDERTDEAVTDALTGLGNRRRLMNDLEEAMGLATPDASWLLAIFDLDGFKGYNDAFGHPAGDAMLARLGEKMAEATGGRQHCYRLGGDEFCLLAPADPNAASRLLDQALEALSEHGEGFSVTSSFGAVILPEHATDATGALREADERLYVQKRGRQATREDPHESLLRALYERDPELHSHAHGVAELAVAVGARLGLAGTELDELERAAMLHDVGKIAIPEEILDKPGPLDPSEQAFLHKHTIVGERIASASPALRAVGRIVRSSHERWDGSGYPDGLSGIEIPLASRIVFACDAASAMMSARPYRRALSKAETLAELGRSAGSQFDPEVARVLVSVLQDRAEAQPDPDRQQRRAS